MNMIKLKDKPSGRYLTISEAHALSLLKGSKEYNEVPIEEGLPKVVAQEAPKVEVEEEDETPASVAQKKGSGSKKKSSKKS